MSKSAKQPLENAVEIIEKFGGIRPMASKTGVAVTTIQGWKKRGVIPGARKNAILAAAAESEIDLSGLVDGAPSLEGVVEAPSQESASVVDDDADKAEGDSQEDEAEESQEPQESKEPQESQEEDQEEASDDDSHHDSEEAEESDIVDADTLEIPAALRRSAEAEKIKPHDYDKYDGPEVPEKDYTEVAYEAKKGAYNRGIIIAIVILLVILAVLAGFVIPKNKHKTQRHDARIEELENKLSAVKNDQSGFKGLMPENWSEELVQLKKQAEEVKKGVGDVVDDAKALSHDLTSAGGLDDRVAQLQTYVSEITGEKGVYALKTRFDQMRRDYMGNKVLDNSVQALLPLIEQMQGEGLKGGSDEHVNAVIAGARAKNEALQTSFGNVPQNELKAAAMLLAMTQVRSALNRPDTAFDSDLVLLEGMINDDNTELKAAIEKLAPYSREGVLTPSGLKSEFQSVAGEAVAASLRGEDVSVSDKLSAKFNELLQVEKDGELLTGTETQATINEAEELVDSDRFEEAISLLKKGLNAKELAPLKPWIRKAEGIAASKKLSGMLEEAIELNFGSGLLGGRVLERNGY